MDTADATVLAVGLVWLAGAPVLLRRVKGEYEDQGRLSDQIVWAVWFSYGLLAAAVVAASLLGSLPLRIDGAVPLTLGILLVAVGLAIDIAGVVSMGSVERINGQNTDRLITEGAFRYSRNPQNVGVGIAGLGVALIGDSGLALALVIAAIVVFRIYLVFEEAHLERTFGDEFRRYSAETPRFLGLPSG